MAKPTQYDAEHPEWRRAVELTRTGQTPQGTKHPRAKDERRPRQRAVFGQVQQPLPQPVNLASRRLHAFGIPLHFAHGNVPDSALGMARCRTAALPSGEAWRLAPRKTGHRRESLTTGVRGRVRDPNMRRRRNQPHCCRSPLTSCVRPAVATHKRQLPPPLFLAVSCRLPPVSVSSRYPSC